MKLPKKTLDESRFWSIGAQLKHCELRAAIQKALDVEREEESAGI